MQTAIMRKQTSVVARRPAAMQARLGARVVRAAAEPENKETPAPGTIFYGGKTYTEAEFEAARQSGSFASSSSSSATPKPAAAAAQVSFGDIMAFSGPAPEIINGRLAMMGFVAAVGAEIASGEPVLRQWAEEPTGIAAFFLLIIAGSLAPLFLGVQRKESFGPLSPNAEQFNGRAAMIGFAAMLILEGINGRSLF